jgi:hypothetical protein
MKTQNFGGVIKPSACGCTVRGLGTPAQPWIVVHCDAHNSHERWDALAKVVNDLVATYKGEPDAETTT